MNTVLDRRVPPQRLVNLVNPLVRMVLHSPLHQASDGGLLALHLTGRRSGRTYDIPVSYLDIDGQLVVITQHRWRVNARGGAPVEVTYRGARRPMHCDLDEDPASVAITLGPAIERIGWRAAEHQLGLKMVDAGTPSVAELEAAVHEFNLASLTLTVR